MSTYTAVRPPAGRRLVAIGNEVAKGLRLGWAERVQILIELPLFTGMLLLLSLLLGRGDEIVASGRLEWSFDPYRTSWLLLGWVIFLFVYLQSVKTFWRLLGEIQTGTLEQVYLSPVPAWVTIAVGRVVAAVVETGFVVGAVYLVASLVTDLRLTWHPEVLVPLALTVVGGAGYALLIAGLTLAWKRIELLQDVLLAVLMFVSGAVIPLSGMPAWVHAVADLLFITHPVEAARISLLDNQPIPLWGTGGWAWLLGTAAGWLLLGVLGYRFCDRYARRRGTLGRY
ncbi:MAG: ABC transporter permease [Micromonosporaceae bacterium]